MAKKLKDLPAQYIHHPVTPPCCAEVQFTLYQRNWRLNRGETEPFTCSRPSVVEIGEKSYCRLHGGHVALDLLLNGRLVEVEK